MVDLDYHGPPIGGGTTSLEQMQTMIDKAVAEQVDKIRRMSVPHFCFTCYWFILREKPPRSRVCRCPGELKVVKGACHSWKLQEDSSKWVRNKHMGR